MGNVNAELYDLLKDNETGMYKENGEIRVYVHLDFCDLEELTEMIGYDFFAEGGLEAQLFHSSLCIELNEIIENHFYHKIEDYKNCFNENDWRDYFDKK